VLTVCENGYGKRTPVEEFRYARAAAESGSSRSTPASATATWWTSTSSRERLQLMVITNRGQIIRTKVSEVRQAGRNTQGVRIIRLDEGEKVVGVEPVAEPDEVGRRRLSPPRPPSR
jgi:DNA gyrase subunit A